MLGYNTRIAIKSLRRHPLLAAVIIAGIALGIWASTTFTTVRHMFARDPLPGRSSRIFYVRMDNWDPARPYPSGEGSKALPVPPQVTYRDSMELMRSKIPVRQTADFITNLVVYPDRKVSRPYTSPIRLCFSDFFPMFNVPFRYGHGWDKRADASAEQVVVIDDATNQKLFGGANSVGKRIRLADRNFTIVGVLAPWRPFIRMYDMLGNFVAEPEPFFIPFSLAPKMELRPFGNSDGWQSVNLTTYQEFLASEVDFIQYWVELRTPADLAAYQRYVDDYVRQQKKSGRFQRPLFNPVRSLRQIMTEYGIVRPQLTAMAVMSILFLVICSMNLTGLLLGKFLARAPEVSVRRALGARRLDIFMQHVIECELVGIAGGVVGMLLSIATLRFIGKLIADSARFSLDLEMVAAAVFLSLVAGLLAGIYPAWRICTVQPAVQLKA
jgi:putative ABC transport system permease protein